jgi:hypothetical protein
VADQHHLARFVQGETAHPQGRAPADPPIGLEQEYEPLRYHARLGARARRGLSGCSGFLEQGMSATAAGIIVGFIALIFVMNLISFRRLD